MSGFLKPLTSFIIVAPDSNANLATSGFLVSTETFAIFATRRSLRFNVTVLIAARMRWERITLIRRLL